MKITSFNKEKKGGGARSQNKTLTFYPDYIEHVTLSLVQTTERKLGRRIFVQLITGTTIFFVSSYPIYE